MIPGLDSSFDRPTPAIASQMYAAGVRCYGGYLGSRDGLGLATRWSRADFEVVQSIGMRAIGFCSGFDDPIWIRDTAASWGLLACVDVESGIRDDGPWIDGWLEVSGAGLYGNASVHFETGQPIGRGAAFNIVSGYFGYDPQATWESWLTRPAAPCGWQWAGGHSEFGLDVDRGWYDDWFAGGVMSSSIPSGGNMGPIVHPTIPNRRDYIYVNPGGGMTHAWWDGANAYTEDVGGQAAPGMVGGAWIDANTLVLTHVSAADGQLYEQAIPIDGMNRTGWYPIYGRAALPTPGPQGPPGPATYVPHKHLTDGGSAI